MPVRRWLALGLLLAVLSGCAVARSPQPPRIALLGPFEGRYREVGYNALYAARLALSEASGPQLDLLPIDDGGSLEMAVARAEALAIDPLVLVVVAVGYHAADPATQAALGDLPVLIPGGWTETRARDAVYVLHNLALADEMTVPSLADVVDAAAQPAPLIGGDVLALEQFPRLRDTLDGVTVLTSGQRPSPEFAARYTASDPFTPPPNLLAMLTYDATTLASQAATYAANAPAARQVASETLAAAEYVGLSGQITFADGLWQEAPRNVYRYQLDGALVAVNDTIK